MSLLWGTAATFKVHEIYIIKERKKKKRLHAYLFIVKEPQK